jgi:DNA polymerase theta
MQFGIAKKIKNGARKIVLEEAEAARVAAFAAFKSLGVEVPQFTAPSLPAIEDSSIRDTMVSPCGVEARSNKVALGINAGDDKNKNNSGYAALRISTYSLREERPGSSIQMKENLANNAKITTQESASPLSTEFIAGSSSTKLTDKGPVNAYNFPGGFDCFLEQWSAVREFFFDVHFIKKAMKPSSNLFEVFGLAVCWENSPIYYSNFPKDLVTTGAKDSREMWANFQRRWKKIDQIMQQQSVKKMTWNLKIQIQALKSAYISCQRLARFHLDHKVLENIEVLDNSYVLLSPISVYSGLDICLVTWVLWPDEESRTVPNLEKVHHKLCSAEPLAFHC